MAHEVYVQYGDIDRGSSDTFLISAATKDEKGVGFRSEPYILMRDESSGQDWVLTAKQAKELADALTSRIKFIK